MTQKSILDKLVGRRAIRVDELIRELIQENTNPQKRTKSEYLISRAIKKMCKDGLLQEHDSGKSKFLGLTPAGRQKLAQYYLSDKKHIMKTSWDGKWRIVILNTAQNATETRNSLRYILKKAGFVCLKNAIWISPLPFEHFLENVKDNLSLHDEMMIIVSEQIDKRSEDAITRYFLK